MWAGLRIGKKIHIIIVTHKPAHIPFAGDLDDSKWNVGRFVGNNNNMNLFPYPQTPVSACKSGVGAVNSDNDIVICDSASGHQRQFLTALGAQYYALLS